MSSPAAPHVALSSLPGAASPWSLLAARGAPPALLAVALGDSWGGAGSSTFCLDQNILAGRDFAVILNDSEDTNWFSPFRSIETRKEKNVGGLGAYIVVLLLAWAKYDVELPGDVLVWETLAGKTSHAQKTSVPTQIKYLGGLWEHFFLVLSFTQYVVSRGRCGPAHTVRPKTRQDSSILVDVRYYSKAKHSILGAIVDLQGTMCTWTAVGCQVGLAVAVAGTVHSSSSLGSMSAKLLVFSNCDH